MDKARCPDCDYLLVQLNSGARACAYCGQIWHDTPEIVNRILKMFAPTPMQSQPEPTPVKEKRQPQKEGLF